MYPTRFRIRTPERILIVFCLVAALVCAPLFQFTVNAATNTNTCRLRLKLGSANTDYVSVGNEYLVQVYFSEISEADDISFYLRYDPAVLAIAVIDDTARVSGLATSCLKGNGELLVRMSGSGVSSDVKGRVCFQIKVRSLADTQRTKIQLTGMTASYKGEYIGSSSDTLTIGLKDQQPSDSGNDGDNDDSGNSSEAGNDGGNHTGTGNDADTDKEPDSGNGSGSGTDSGNKNDSDNNMVVDNGSGGGNSSDKDKDTGSGTGSDNNTTIDDTKDKEPDSDKDSIQDNDKDTDKGTGDPKENNDTSTDTRKQGSKDNPSADKETSSWHILHPPNTQADGDKDSDGKGADGYDKSFKTGGVVVTPILWSVFTVLGMIALICTIYNNRLKKYGRREIQHIIGSKKD